MLCLIIHLTVVKNESLSIPLFDASAYPITTKKCFAIDYKRHEIYHDYVEFLFQN